MSSDHSPPPGLPTPPAGVGAADLATDSSDPKELRELLDQARERLAFYESFDRIIGENIRRSGELMVETVSLREQAQALAAKYQKEREGFAATRQADQERYRALVADALKEIESARPVIDGLVGRLQGLLQSLEEDGSPDTSGGTAIATMAALVEPWHTGSDDPATATADPAADPASTTDEDIPQEDEAASVEGEAGPRTINLLAHGVPSAKVAIQLQNMLRGLAPVTRVDTREFANGELRLTVTAIGTLPEADITAWLGDNNGELTSSSPSVIELNFT